MTATISSGGLWASAFVTADLPLRRRLLPSVALPLRQSAAPVPAVRAAASPSSSKPAAAKTGRGITKPRPVSPAMQALVGVPEIPRTHALKLIWAYIKEHNLQICNPIPTTSGGDAFPPLCFAVAHRLRRPIIVTLSQTVVSDGGVNVGLPIHSITSGTRLDRSQMSVHVFWLK